MIRPLLALLTAAVSLALAVPASAGIFGTYPLRLSVSPSGGEANGPSGSPTVSGDNRKTRFAAFHSDATNLVGGDTNGKRDIFLWSRPRGSAGLALRPGAGSLSRVSVTNSGGQANGDSFSPSLDGSIAKKPHCVAFQSLATNLAAGDRDTTADIFVRDFRARKTFLVSRNTVGAASDPSIAGDCSKVAFVTSNRVVVQGVRGGRAQVLGPGGNPDFALDGRAVTWESNKKVVLRRDGRKSIVGVGQNPTVTDAERLAGQRASKWGVSYESGGKVLLRVFGPKGGAKKTVNITRGYSGANANGGITAYGATRGIITFATTTDDSTSFYYYNENSGNADDLAHSAAIDDETPGITEMVTSARANFVAFTSAFTGSFARAGRGGEISDQTEVYFKHLVDGERV